MGPLMSSETNMTVWVLSFNSPDTVVQEMVENHGGRMASPHCALEMLKEGPWRGQYNGNRKQKVHMAGQVLSIGSYYLLDDARIRI